MIPSLFQRTAFRRAGFSVPYASFQLSRKLQTETVRSNPGSAPVATAHPVKTPEDDENFWKVAADDSAFWEAYVSTRPNYSAAFYNEMYTHHARNANSWKLAHDVGCGAGQVASELTTRFRHVVASDMNDTHISVAKRRMNPAFEGTGKVSYTNCKGEDIHTFHDHGQVDFIAAAEAMVLMDEPSALRSFHNLLRPGGTLAFWFYGRPTFSDLNLRKTGQPLIDEIMVRNWAKVIRGSGERRAFGFKRAADGMASWLDYVNFNTSEWTDIRRIKWNPDATLPFFGEAACGFPIDVVSNVKPGEKCEERVDRNWWRNDWEVTELMKYFRVLFPGFEAALQKSPDAEIDRLFAALHHQMGGPGVVHHFTWPAVLVMATKK